MAKDTKSPEERLQEVVNETSGTALTLSPQESQWSGYLLQQKQKFEAPTLPKLCEAITEAIVSKRTTVEVKEGGKAPKKPFKYSA